MSIHAIIISCALAQPVPPAPVQADAPVSLADRVPDLNRRLEALRPANPAGYFELGEEVAAEAATDADRRLARDLYILALELSRKVTPAGQSDAPATLGPPDPLLARSVCLALAAMESADEQRRWLIALADTTGADLSAEPVPIRTTTTSRDPAAFDLASALGSIRIGEGRRAQAILSRPGVAALFERVSKLLTQNFGSGADQVRRHAEQWPTCPRCLNRRFIREGAGPTGVVVCPHCLGTPGPRLSDEELLAQIRTESVLLSGQARSWAAQIVSDGGSPLRELDIDELARVFSVDPARPVWRNGQWMPVADRKPAKP
ncbi:MAG: hypothetical protein K2W85_03790 [Phycisphaerales bacterium]|nr:hypothetical protein [Phycisphaerales bacterium]